MKNLYNKINFMIDCCEEELISIRRDFHKHPECGWTEFRTASKIAAYLEDNNISIKFGEDIFDKESRMGVQSSAELEHHQNRALLQGASEKYISRMTGGYTGIVATIDTGKTGPTVAFRFDIDANDCTESSLPEHRPFKEGFSSQNNNAMHACGHDGHAAIGMVLAKTVNHLKDELTGKFIFIFQPAEEGVRGAYSMVKKGLLDDVDYLLSGHIGFSSNKVGQVVCCTDGFLATTKMDITFKGHSSHAGAYPQRGKNALLAAAAATLNLHTLCQHEEGMARINVGVLQAGTGRNIVPDRALIKLETRGETSSINDYITKRAEEVLSGAAVMYNVDYKVAVLGKADRSTSDRELGELVATQLKFVPEVNEIIPFAKLSGSEDVTYMMNKVKENGGKALYMMFGTSLSADHHNVNFDFDERVLKIAVKAYLAGLIGLCGKEVKETNRPCK